MAVAERLYAKALFEAAEDRAASSGPARPRRVRRRRRGIARADSFLANPQVDPAAKVDVLGQLSAGSDELVHNFLRLVAAKGRAGQIPGIRDEFQALVDRAQGRVAVELTTAFELSDDEAASIVAQIEQSSGRKVEATRKVDPELVGGMILQAGSLRVDASVRGRLERLRHELATR